MAETQVLAPPAIATEIAAGASTSAYPQVQIGFVEEIRSSRLTILWKATLISTFIFAWVVLLFSGTSGTPLFELFLPIGIVVVSSFGTRRLLQQNRYQLATWVYALGVLLALSAMMLPDNETSRSIVPALGILVIFVVGMLMSVRDTVLLLLVSYILMIPLPWLYSGENPVTDEGLFAFILMGISALAVTQVSGELYSIADWALASYRKERETATKLHQSRLDVEHSLLKQQNLTLQLQNANQELDDAREAAELAKQFRGQFLANMSHELRTPLNAVIGFSETMLSFPMMYDGIELPVEYRQDMERIFTSGKHLLGIINDILDLSKIDVGRLEIELRPVDLEPIFKGLLSTAVGLVGAKPVDLKRELPKELPMVIGDQLRVRQVLLNLYSNAAKFTEEGAITLRLKTELNRVIISVSDTGPGISPGNIERIFEAFQQGESGRRQKRAGAGLGLAISQQLLDLMDGSIWVESEVDKGSTFHISLPLYQPDTNEEWAEVEEEVS